MARQDITEEVSEAIRNMIGLQSVLRTRVAVDPASIAAEGTAATAVVATGALPGDFVLAAPETDDILSVNAGIHWYVSDADEVVVNISNNIVAAGAAIDLASATWVFQVFRSTET